MEGASSSSSTTNDYQVLVDTTNEEIFLTSDEKFVEELQFQEALLYSVSSNTTLTDVDFNTLLRKLKLNEKGTFEDESSSSSSSSSKQSYCAICLEAKPIEEMFKSQNCSHSFCEECVGTYLTAKIQEKISMVTCPDPKCNAILVPNDCISIISKEVFDRWGNALCENFVTSSQKFYCPFNDCSAMLVNDDSEVVTVSECPHCHRLFCAQCRVTWHVGVNCREFRSLKVSERGRADLMAMELAKNKKWKRCPKCSFYVERSVGCTRITCRCGNQFCYGCGSTWNKDSHYKCAS